MEENQTTQNQAAETSSNGDFSQPLSLLEMLEITIKDQSQLKAKIEAIEDANIQFQMEWDARLTDLEINLKGGE